MNSANDFDLPPSYINISKTIPSVSRRDAGAAATGESDGAEAAAARRDGTLGRQQWFCEHRCQCQQRRATNVDSIAPLPSLPLPLYTIREEACFLGNGGNPAGSVNGCDVRGLVVAKTRAARPPRAALPRRRRARPAPAPSRAAKAAARSLAADGNAGDGEFRVDVPFFLFFHFARILLTI